MTSPAIPAPPVRKKPGPKRRPLVIGPKDIVLMEGLLLGMPMKDAAARAGMPVRTAQRHRNDPVWTRRFMEAEAEAVKEVTRRGIRAAQAAMQVLTQIAGNVAGAAERPEARVQVHAASRLLSAFVGMHGRAVQDADSDVDLSTPTIEYVLVGVDTEALR